MSLLGFVILWLLGSEVTEADVKAYLDYGKRGAVRDQKVTERELANAKRQSIDAKRFEIHNDKQRGDSYWVSNGDRQTLFVLNKKVGVKVQNDLKKQVKELELRIKNPPSVIFRGSDLVNDLPIGSITIPLVPAHEVMNTSVPSDAVSEIMLNYLLEEDDGWYRGQIESKYCWVKSKDRLPTKLFIKTPCRIDEVTGREIKLYLFTDDELKELEAKVMEALKK